jgi:glycosyltransferase involved in cell wall biosynthesis
MKKISVCIPTYEYNGLGAEVLEYSFNRLRFQDMRGDFEVCISDNSADDRTKELCERWSDLLDIKYFKNPYRGAALNSNVAIRMANAPLIKFLCADDYLADNGSLRAVYENFDDDTAWLFTAYVHTKDRINHYRIHYPMINSNIALINTLGTPSAMTIRNADVLKYEEPYNNLFDINLNYMYDCDFYYRMNNVFGAPKVIPYIGMANYIWNESVTSQTTDEMMRKESEYIIKKYKLVIK